MKESIEKRVSTLESEKELMMTMVGNKSNKASVATALHRKANKKEVEESFEQTKASIEAIEKKLLKQHEDLLAKAEECGNETVDREHKLESEFSSSLKHV